MPAGDGNFQEFIRDRLVWRTEEKLRTRKFFHDLLSSKIMVASFAAHAALEKAIQRAQENGELARVTALLHEVIDAIVHGFDERTEQTGTIPKEEAASVWRLAASIQLSDRDKPTSLGG